MGVLPGIGGLAGVSESAGPSIVNSNTSSMGLATSHTVNLPSGIVAGNLLLIFFANNEDRLPSTPSGWTRLVTDAATGGTSSNQDTLTVFAKIATGSEGATVSCTTAANVRSAHTSYQVTGNRNGVTAAEILAAIVVGASNQPKSPNLAPGWGAAMILWFSAIAATDGSRTISSYPAGYTLGQLTVSSTGSSAGSRIASAAKSGTTASEDPGVYTLNSSDNWVAVTVGIRPQ